MSGNLLVRKGGEQFYCPPSQAEVWASMGYGVYEIELVKIAGPDVDHDESVTATGTGSAGMEPQNLSTTISE